MTTTEKTPTSTEGAAALPITETFMESTTDNPHWKIHPTAVLNGCLELTPDNHNKSGAALLDQAFPSSEGVVIDFDYSAEHRGGNSAGDGFSVFLIDGSTTTEPGGYGAGLGYSSVKHSSGNKKGVTKGYVGIGFDTYGNFGGTLAGPGGPGNSSNMVCVRGSGDEWNGFNWLTGKAAPGGFRASWEDGAHVQITIVDGRITVRMSSKAAPNGTTVIDSFPIQGAGQAAPPATFKLGIAASTGAATQAHRIRRLKIALPVEMPLEITGPATADAGTKVCYPISVRNDGPNDAPDAVVEGVVPPQLSNLMLKVETSGGASAGTGSATGGLRQELSLPRGGSATVTVCGTIDAQHTGPLTISAKIISPTRANTSPRQHGEVTTNVEAKAPALDLVVKQEIGMEDAPGGLGTTLNVTVTGREHGRAVDPGPVEHVFTAPTGFRWNGHVGAQYKRFDQTTAGDLPPVEAHVSDDGRTLTFTYNPHLFTSDEDRDLIVYICGIEAVDDAQPGRYTDGQALVGTAPPAKLKGTVLGSDD
ncbi:hypothetical protein ABZX75_26115 [Streptomyces sp. NPDC003038]|uniref:lectin-like domain-containing protein n=1 Tax=unclassified Streptomyces TaxID=2593676 RepID=UPI0033A89217